MIIDAVLETHDRVVGKVYSDCKRMRDDQLVDQKKLANETLISFMQLGVFRHIGGKVSFVGAEGH
ncbi:MAG: hypothetical protein K0M45_01345, partial [Candidatus Paracaedibacteraceae bacterium]|nr:hypothetical protein [Candidatus Paracaedibacteraceae bacterium]